MLSARPRQVVSFHPFPLEEDEGDDIAKPAAQDTEWEDGLSTPLAPGADVPWVTEADWAARRNRAAFTPYIPSTFSRARLRPLHEFARTEVLSPDDCLAMLSGAPPRDDVLGAAAFLCLDGVELSPEQRAALPALLSRMPALETLIIRRLRLACVHGLVLPAVVYLDLSDNSLCDAGKVPAHRAPPRSALCRNPAPASLPPP